MTIPEIATQLHKLSVNGYFNHEKFTRLDLLHYIRDAFQWRIQQLQMEILLPDGWWHFVITRFSDKPDGYDYAIPDTREQEAELKARK